MKFSIITCTYNSQKYLQSCLTSLAEQNFKNFEVLIIDGYSTDRTLNIIQKFKKTLPIKVYKQKPSGISTAMNLGIKKARGEYLIHLHSDDMLYDKNVLRDADNFLKNNNLDWIYGKISIIEENGKEFGIFPKHRIFTFAWGYLLKYINYIPHQSVLIKKDVFESLGYFDETLSSQMDIDMWFRICNKTNWKFFNRIITKYRLHSHSQSASLKNKIINQKNYEIALHRYTNPLEFLLATFIGKMINKNNKNLR